MYSIFDSDLSPPLLHEHASSAVRDLAVRFDRDAWIVERVDRSCAGVRFPLREEAEAYALRTAARLAPCWVRIYTASGDLRVACHAR